MNIWHPIATIPRDTDVLACNRRELGSYQIVSLSDCGKFLDASEGLVYQIGAFTDWTHLPELPSPPSHDVPVTPVAQA